MPPDPFRQFRSVPPWLLRMLCGWAVAVGMLASSAPADDPPGSGNDLVTVRVVSDVQALTPGGRFTLGVQYTIKPGWHLYWRNAGASGMPPTVDVLAPDGFEVGKPVFPRPMIFGSGADTTYGYEDTLLLMIPMTCPAQLSSSEIRFELTLDWVVCKVACLIGEATKTLHLPVAPAGREGVIDPRGARLIEQWEKRVPRSIPAGDRPGGFSARLTDRNHLVLKGVAGAATSALYIPGGTPGVSPTVPGPISGVLANGTFIFDIPMSIVPEDALGEPLRVNGLVLLGTYERPRAIELNLPINDAKPVIEESGG
ncbi:MAG: protein-disulfide reductase DsbD domain-containing protein [Planctomycetota bacterium]|nr:protein-disulfide reductase DsbD domain-containing protein [Planctomycetota bacterium]